MSNILKHEKQVTQLDSADPTLMQPSDWNNGHKLTGGTHGQVVVRDTTDVTFGMALSSLPNINGFISNFAAVSSPVDGSVWVEVSGTSPTRVAELKFRDGGVTRTLMSITY